MGCNVMDQILRSPRSEYLDIIRGIAIFGVVVFHTSQLTNEIVINHSGRPKIIFTDFFNLGAYGVELFFVLSGWLLASIYQEKGTIGKSYWVRRLAKIMPLWVVFYVGQILYAQLGVQAGWYSARQVSPGQNSFLHSPLGITLTTMTFTLWISSSLWNTVIPGAWSIQAEVGHYLLFPKIRNMSLRGLLIFASCFNCFSIVLILFSLTHYYSQFPIAVQQIIAAYLRLNLFTTFDFFLIGIISYRIYSQYFKIGKLSIARNELNKNSFAFIFFVLSFMFVPLTIGRIIEAVGFIFTSLIIGLGILRVSQLRILFMGMGKYSYFIYFIHFQLLFFLTRWTNNVNFGLNYDFSQIVIFVPLLFSTLALSILLGYFSYRYFEAPILRRAQKVRN
jgi:peptidoglycan/LPS O-acetylase OafA/YrhL